MKNQINKTNHAKCMKSNYGQIYFNFIFLGLNQEQSIYTKRHWNKGHILACSSGSYNCYKIESCLI